MGEPPDPFDDRAIQEPRVMENLAEVLQEESMKEEAMAEERTADEIEDNGETGILDLDVVANRALVPQKRFGEDNLAGVEWIGRCWVWLTEGETPALMDVVVNDGEIVKLLEPGRVRRVRAKQRAVETRIFEGEIVRVTGGKIGCGYTLFVAPESLVLWQWAGDKLRRY